MWFVFPQMRGLGHSSTAQFYGLVSLDEARAVPFAPRPRAAIGLGDPSHDGNRHWLLA
ncbi:DUF1810 family protein [Bosea sp. Root381]|uniref:DUF1810 family protein n=1 Tax=Bosea sp. Root381 TaxID=1736524 RepID=UPI003299226E